VAKGRRVNPIWPFEELPLATVITVRQVMSGETSILFVSRDDNGLWHFLPGGSCDARNAVPYALAGMVGRDSTLKSLFDLPRGWQATRETSDEPWERKALGR
jgi:hypothetical protein